MAQQTINVGATANDGTGDGLRNAYIKCNDNFDELYSRFQDTVPASNIGTTGDTKGMYAADYQFLYVCYQDYDGSSVIWARTALSTSW